MRCYNLDAEVKRTLVYFDSLKNSLRTVPSILSAGCICDSSPAKVVRRKLTR